MLYYEDIEIGTRQSFGSYAVTREEVIEFAARFDPQPFHLDDDAAAATHFGRLAIEKRRSKSRPEMGLFKSRIAVFNQHGQVVLEMVSNGLIRVRDPEAPIEG